MPFAQFETSCMQLSAIEYRSVTSRRVCFQNILISALDPEKAH